MVKSQKRATFLVAYWRETAEVVEEFLDYTDLRTDSGREPCQDDNHLPRNSPRQMADDRHILPGPNTNAIAKAVQVGQSKTENAHEKAVLRGLIVLEVMLEGSRAWHEDLDGGGGTCLRDSRESVECLRSQELNVCDDP